MLNSPDIQATEDLLIQQAFPLNVTEEVKTIFKQVSIQTIHKTSHFFAVTIDGAALKIPYRIYYDDSALSHLTGLIQVQQDIVNCIFSRHYNGFVRQKCISKVITSNYSWTIPFIVQAVGEYVIEILQDINDKINLIDKTNLRNFLLDNKEFYKLTQNRVASYWNYNYRLQFPNKADYVGFKILKHFDKIIS